MTHRDASGADDRFESCLHALHNPVAAVDAHGRVVFANLALAGLFSLTPDALAGTDCRDALAPLRLMQTVRSGAAELAERLDIGGRTFIANRAPVRRDGRVVGAVALLQEITGIEAESSELARTRQINQELDAIIESSVDGIYVCDGTGLTIRVNQAYERITGIRREDVLGKRMQALVDMDFFNESVTLRVIQSRRTETLIQTNKTGKTVMVTGNPFFDDQGGISLVVTTVRDVTELNRLQGDLERMESLRERYESELEKLREGRGDGPNTLTRSKTMQEIYDLAVRVAQVDATILIQGESGVGKEDLVDLIHLRGPRHDKPLVKISCAAIPEHLLESELFGYVPGAFTGASRNGKAGLFETAHEGTLFLDEIGELPKRLQAKLLRVLQQREIIRVGSTGPVPVDVRIIAATNRDLQAMVERKEFRADLFFRLQVVPIHIPALRRRREDIIPLARHFLAACNAQYGCRKRFEPRVLDILASHDWPGNVRQLKNLVERLVVVTPSDAIRPGDLPEGFAPGAAPAPLLAAGSLQAALHDLERRILEQALETHKSTRKMARALGIDQATVVRKLKRHGLRP
ncbi:sigma-54 interaction domain-containing protein [Desulfocurvus sp. DL9XJH121]